MVGQENSLPDLVWRTHFKMHSYQSSFQWKLWLTKQGLNLAQDTGCVNAVGSNRSQPRKTSYTNAFKMCDLDKWCHSLIKCSVWNLFLKFISIINILNSYWFPMLKLLTVITSTHHRRVLFWWNHPPLTLPPTPTFRYHCTQIPPLSAGEHVFISLIWHIAWVSLCACLWKVGKELGL